jgi:citrate lyase subunit beta/citryl-CoA lyase
VHLDIAQVDVIREAYAPTAEEVEAAQALLTAAEGERGVFQFNGRMVDEPVLRHARRIVERARI